MRGYVRKSSRGGQRMIRPMSVTNLLANDCPQICIKRYENAQTRM